MNLRELFIEWLTASRYIQALEAHHREVRKDLDAVILDKHKQLVAMRIELAEVKADNDRMRLVLMPLGSPAGQMYAQKFRPVAVKPVEVVDVPLDWNGELKKMLEEEEDGIRNVGRIQEHEPSADDGA